jgi:hypothetical protein
VFPARPALLRHSGYAKAMQAGIRVDSMNYIVFNYPLISYKFRMDRTYYFQQAFPRVNNGYSIIGSELGVYKPITSRDIGIQNKQYRYRSVCFPKICLIFFSSMKKSEKLLFHIAMQNKGGK